MNQQGGPDISQLSLEQLNRFKKEEEMKMQQIQQNYTRLKQAQAKFVQSKRTISNVNKSMDSKEIMIPLTESLYVNASFKDPSKFMVELGTGFYAEKTVKQTVEFLERKETLVHKNSENILKAMDMTRKNIESIIMEMQRKIELHNQNQ